MFVTFTAIPRSARRAGRFLAALLAVAAILLGPPPGSPGRAAQTEGEWDDSLAGRLLVASDNMGDPRFRNSVIYMVEHDSGGAMGLIVNKPLGAMSVARLFEQFGLEAPPVAPGAAGEIEVYYGGPVDPGRGFLLHSADVVMADSVLVDGRIALTARPDMLRKIARGEGPERSIFTLGYSGWGPGQLESEFDRNDWFVIHADISLVFATNPAKTWERAAARRSLDL